MKFGYARVSTEEQNLDLQISALEKAGCDKIYQEKVSAVKNRPELNSMISALREGDEVVVWKMDRLARSLKHLLLLVEEFKSKKVGFVSIRENINTDSATGKFFFSITGAFAELERGLIIERTLAGLEEAKKRGVKLGRRSGLTPEAKSKAEMAKCLYNDKKDTRSICKALNISSATLYRYLRSEGVDLRKG